MVVELSRDIIMLIATMSNSEKGAVEREWAQLLILKPQTVVLFEKMILLSIQSLQN